MAELSIKNKVLAFRGLLELESRTQRIDDLINQLKDQLLDHTTVFPQEVVSPLDELIAQLRKSAELVPTLVRTVGVPSGTPRGEEHSTRAASTTGLKGSTKTVTIPELLGLLSTQRKTGTLWIKSGDEGFLLELSEGCVVHAVTSNPRPHQRLGTILVARNKVSHERLEAAITRANGGGRVGEIVLRAELVSQEDLRDALEQQVQELFHRIYTVEDAVFMFREGTLSELETRVCMRTTQLLLEAARWADERLREHSLAAAGAADPLPVEPQ